MPPYASRLDSAATRQAQPPHGSAARNLAAGAAAGAVVVQLALAQVTLALTIAFLVIAVVTRWRPAWLAWPAAAGVCWIAVIGPARAGADYVASAWHMVSVLAGSGSLAAPVRGLASATAGWQRWLPGQLPVALMAAAAEVALARWLSAALWPPGRRGCRPGLLVLVRRCYVLASLRRGEVATADGGCLGVIADTGRRAAVSWREAAGGVLVTGLDAGAVASTCLDLAAAAIGHRKSVIVIDLTSGVVTGGEHGRRGAATVPCSVLRAMTTTCASAGAPLAIYGHGRERYEPFGDAGPAAAADLLIAMTGLAEDGHGRRAFCAEYARAAFEVITAGAGSAGTRQRPGVVDDVAVLLRPGALEARLSALGQTLNRPTGPAEHDALALLAARLASLRRSPAGALLSRPAEAGSPAISLARALARRQVVLFPLDPRPHGAGGVMIARLIVADLVRVLGERAGAGADVLAWINGCEAMDAGSVAALLETGQAAGVATMLSTADGATAAALGAQLNVVVLRGRSPRGLTGRAALGGGVDGVHGNADVLPAAMLAARRGDALSVLVRAPVPRTVTSARVTR